MIKLMEVRDRDKYYEKLNIGITMSNMWNSLQTKSEYGTDKSEKGYQQVAKSMSGSIARELGLDSNLTECLSMCYGSYFPAYGKAGKKVILQYLREHGMLISEEELARSYVEYDLSQSGNVITPEFDRYLRELFGNSVDITIPEVKVARLCGDTIDDIKRIERASTINKIDLLYAMTKDVESECIKAGKPVKSAKIQEMLSAITNENIDIDDETRKRIYGDLDDFVLYAEGEKINGVYDYIGTDEIEL